MRVLQGENRFGPEPVPLPGEPLQGHGVQSEACRSETVSVRPAWKDGLPARSAGRKRLDRLTGPPAWCWDRVVDRSDPGAAGRLMGRDAWGDRPGDRVVRDAGDRVGRHLHSPRNGYPTPIPSANRALNVDRAREAGPS